MNKLQEKIVQMLNPAQLNMKAFTDLVYKSVELKVFDSELVQYFKKYLKEYSNDTERFYQSELIEFLANPYNIESNRPAFELLKVYVNLIIDRPYERCNGLCDYYNIIIALIDCEKFSLIPKDSYARKNIYELNNYFVKFLEKFIKTISLDLELENEIESIIDTWALIDLRTFCMNYKSNSFVQDFFSFLDSDSSLYRDSIKVYQKLRYHFDNEEVQYQYLEDYRESFTYNSSMTPLFEITKTFSKYFTTDPISYFMDLILFYTAFDGENRKIEKDRFYSSFETLIKSFIRNMNWIANDTTKNETLHNVVYPAIIKSLCKYSITNESIRNEITILSLDVYEKYKDNANDNSEFHESIASESVLNTPMTYESAMEAYKKSSGVIQKAERKVYKAYKKYKIQEDKVDSQAQKVVNWMKKLVVGDKRKEVIEGKTYTPLTLLKRLLITLGVFSVSHVAAACMLIVRFALSKELTRRERMKVVSDLEVELELLNEKIEDARAAGDNKAKYEMMRSRAELQKAIKKIKYGMEASSKASDRVKATIGV